MELLRSTLPSGLTVWRIDNEDIRFQQRADYASSLPETECIINVSRPTKVQMQTDSEKGGGDTRKEKKQRIPSFLQQLVAEVDDSYDSLTPAMRRATEKYMKEKLLDFVMCESGHSVLGPKKCREAVGYITSNKFNLPCDAFFELCSFLLDAKVHIGHKVYTWDDQSCTHDIHFKTFKN